MLLMCKIGGLFLAPFVSKCRVGSRGEGLNGGNLGGLFEHILFVLREGGLGWGAREGREKGAGRGGCLSWNLKGGNEADAHPDLATLQ